MGIQFARVLLNEALQCAMDADERKVALKIAEAIDACIAAEKERESAPQKGKQTVVLEI